MTRIPRPDPHVVVVFGAAGDLARRMLLPALYHLAEEGLLPDRYRIIGNARRSLSDEEFRGLVKDAAAEFCRCKLSKDTWERFSGSLSYVSGEFGPENTGALGEAVATAEAELGEGTRRLFYLAVPPPAFAPITKGLGACGLTERARVVYEKPFGSDLASARKLNEAVHSVFDEPQVYRIDHFLGKETVQNILALRFANGVFEPIWNRGFVDHVQIDVPETIGIGDRADFYEETGALRDMVVTHLFQVLSFVAMEPPASFSPEALVAEKLKVFESMVPLQPENVVRGQYEGYRGEEGVAPDSAAETLVAARVSIDNSRWTGVPFFLRTGKRLAEQRTTVTVAFSQPPREMFPEPQVLEQDRLFLDLSPTEGISLSFMTKAPGYGLELAPARMRFDYEGSFGSPLIKAYERLVHDVLIGDRTLFTDGRGIERTWELVAPVLEDPPDPHIYRDGSWGPEAARQLIAPRRWSLPDE